MRRIKYVFAFLVGAALYGGVACAAVLSWDDVEQMPPPPAGEHIAYGALPMQFAELRVPSGRGPFPVAVLIHGGCWLSGFDHAYFNHLADALARIGIASWTIEYRRVGDEGGGWPGTFLDVSSALDLLPTLAKTRALDTRRVIAIGHSSGAQLALWAAARNKLPARSILYSAKPFKLAGVIGLAPITDLASYRISMPSSCNAVVDDLLDGSPESVPERYAQTSPRALLPLGLPQRLIQGAQDSVVSIGSVKAYASAAKAAGDSVVLLEIPSAGHFEPAIPLGPSWSKIKAATRELLGAP